MLVRDEKRKILYVLSAAAFLGPFSQSIYAPSIVAVRSSFDTSFALVLATIAIYTFVLGIAQLAYGPVVDALSGRPVLIAGLCFYGIASTAAYFAPTIPILIGLRALQAVGIATASVVGASVIAGLFGSEERARALGFFQMSVSLGVVLGPVVGSLIAAILDWRATFPFLLLCAGLILSVVVRQLPAQQTAVQRFTPADTLRIVGNPATLGAALLAFGQYYALATFTNMVAILFAGPGFALDAGWIGPLLLPFTIGLAIGSPLGGRFADQRGRRTAIKLGNGAAAACAGLFLTLLLLPPSRLLIVPLAGTMALLGLSLGFNWPGQLSLMVEWFPKTRGTAVGVYNFTRFMGSASGALVGGYVTDRYGVGYAFISVFALLAMGVAVAEKLVREPR